MCMYVYMLYNIHIVYYFIAVYVSYFVLRDKVIFCNKTAILLLTDCLHYSLLILAYFYNFSSLPNTIQ